MLKIPSSPLMESMLKKRRAFGSASADLGWLGLSPRQVKKRWNRLCLLFSVGLLDDSSTLSFLFISARKSSKSKPSPRDLDGAVLSSVSGKTAFTWAVSMQSLDGKLAGRFIEDDTRGPGPLPCDFEFSPRPWGGLEPCSCALGCVGKKAGCMSFEVGDVLKAEAGFDEYFGGSNFGGRLPLDTGGSKGSSELPFLPLSINVRGAGLDRWLSKENRFFLNSTALGRTSVALATRPRKRPPLAPAPQFSPDPLCGSRMTLSPGRLNLPRAMTSLVLLSNCTSCASITEQRS